MSGKHWPWKERNRLDEGLTDACLQCPVHLTDLYLPGVETSVSSFIYLGIPITIFRDVTPETNCKYGTGDGVIHPLLNFLSCHWSISKNMKLHIYKSSVIFLHSILWNSNVDSQENSAKNHHWFRLESLVNIAYIMLPTKCCMCLNLSSQPPAS